MTNDRNNKRYVTIETVDKEHQVVGETSFLKADVISIVSLRSGATLIVLSQDGQKYRTKEPADKVIEMVWG